MIWSQLPNAVAGSLSWLDVEYGGQAWLDARKADLTSTDAAVLYDASPYKDLFTLWHQKHGDLPDAVDDNDAMFWGRFMEAGIAYGVAAKEGYVIEKADGYYRLPGTRLGATPDYFITATHKGGKNAQGVPIPTMVDSIGILECKNVSYQAWQESWNHKQADGSILISPPVHYELQLLEQCVVTGLEWGVIGCVVGGNTHHVFYREFTQEMKDQFLAKVADFWAMKQPPNLVTDKSIDALKHLYEPDDDKEAFYDASGDVDALAAGSEYLHARAEEKRWEEVKKAAEAKLRQKLGNYPKMKAPNFSVSRSVFEKKETVMKACVVDRLDVREKKV